MAANVGGGAGAGNVSRAAGTGAPRAGRQGIDAWLKAFGSIGNEARPLSQSLDIMESRSRGVGSQMVRERAPEREDFGCGNSELLHSIGKMRTEPRVL